MYNLYVILVYMSLYKDNFIYTLFLQISINIFFLNLAWTDGQFISCMLLGDFGLWNSFPENKKTNKNILNIKRPFCIKQFKKKKHWNQFILSWVFWSVNTEMTESCPVFCLAVKCSIGSAHYCWLEYLVILRCGFF